jgi:hypothetical protein
MSDLLDANVREMARLSDGAYGGKDVEGYTIDKQLSSPDRTAYVKDGKVTLAYRGTDFKNKSNTYRDLGTNALLALGLQDVSSRFKNAKKASDQAIEKYGKDNVNVTGHSLGGSQALYLSNKRGLQGSAFNPFAGVVDSLRKRTYNATAYVNQNDPIASLTGRVSGLKRHVIKGKKSNPHSLAHFI